MAAFTLYLLLRPQPAQATFFSEMQKTISPHFEGLLVMSGDSNIAFDQLSDKKGAGAPQPKSPPKQSLRITHFLHSLVNIWRKLNPSSKDFVHYLGPHKTIAITDHIFLSTLDIHTALQTSFRDIAWSDHSLILLKLIKACVPSGSSHWHNNKSLLSDPVNCTMLEKESWEFFLIHDVEDISSSSLWGAHKVVNREKLRFKIKTSAIGQYRYR